MMARRRVKFIYQDHLADSRQEDLAVSLSMGSLTLSNRQQSVIRILY